MWVAHCFYYENDIYLWDIAAGVLLVKEAGGKIYMKRKGNSWKYEVLASNKFIFDEACKLLVKCKIIVYLLRHQRRRCRYDTTCLVGF